MARKTRIIQIADDGRDKGKSFLLTEMPASQAAKWATRAFLALGRASVQVPDEIASAGFAGAVFFGLQMLGNMRYADAEPLIAELMACVQAQPDSAHPEIIRRLIEEDIEEPATHFRLQKEVWELHAGFSLADVPSILMPGTPAQT